MPIHKHKAYSFSDYIKIITEIGEYSKIDAQTPSVLWTRGQRKQEWNLKPTNGIKDSSGWALEEEVRKQHYIAKNYHFFTKEPRSKAEWMEVMQHHGVKTRMLDWSESSLHSLIFAIDFFLIINNSA